MKRNYESPVLEEEVLSLEDVIATSFLQAKAGWDGDDIDDLEWEDA